MNFPTGTGEAARYLGITEPELAQAVRLGKISPAPPIIAGRRLWEPEHVLQAAEALGLLTDELRQELERAARARERADLNSPVSEI